MLHVNMLIHEIRGILDVFFMCATNYCGLRETTSPLFNILVNKCQVIKEVLMREKEREGAARQQWKEVWPSLCCVLSF